MTQDPTRREFLAATALTSAAGAALLHGCASASDGAARRSRRPAVSGPLTGAEPVSRVRVGMIGTGSRGSTHVRLLLLMDDVEIVAVADPHVPSAQRAEKACADAGKPEPTLYTDDDHGYRKILERDDVDAVVISSPWKWHHPQGTEAMRAGKHAFIEVPLGLSLDELWDLVETSEATGRHCMMLENVNYGRDELMTLNLCRQKVFGELLHGEAAYIHDLRSQMNDVGWGTGSWRTAYHAKTQGNLYPTHGLGPVAQYMNLDRTDDRFDTLVSYSSPALGRNLYAKNELAEDNPHRKLDYTCGDLSSSLIRTQLGRTILVQYDTTSPRPYTRHNLIQGTGGCLCGFPTRLAVEAWGDYHHWIEGDALDEVREKYEHPLWKRMGREAEAAGGHGGMDYIMLRRIIECLKNGDPMDQSVYEGASWSAVRPLSEKSVNNGGAPVTFPDFSRGRYRQIKPLAVIA